MKGIVLEIHQDRCVLLKADGIYGRYLCDAPAQAQPGYFFGYGELALRILS